VFPYVWLPTIMVTAALLGHVAVYKKLLSHDPLAKPTVGEN